MTFLRVRSGLAPVVMLCAACSSADGEGPRESVGVTRMSVSPQGSWVGTWAASPQGGGGMFSQQTLRQIVHTSIAGSAARIQFSNAYGSSPVDLADVHIARRTSDSSIDPATDVAVTFGGQTTTTVPAGGLTVSDSIAFAVPAFSDVAVSAYLPQSVNIETFHQQGTQTNYIATGDVSGSAALGNPQTSGSYYLLANLDVQSSAALGAVVALGASITDGYASAQDQNHRWPNFLATRMDDAGLTVGVLNQGISGNDLLQDGAGQSALKRFQRDVASQPGVRWVIFSDDPINDLGTQGDPPTADQLIAGLRQLIATAHDNGIQFLCSTLTPFQGAFYWTATGETGREAYDAFVRMPGNGCDAIVDQDTATHDPAMPTWFLPADDSDDHLHPSDMGRQAIADAVPLSVFAAVQAAGDAGGEPDAEAGADAKANNDSGSTPYADSGASPAVDAGTEAQADAGFPTMVAGDAAVTSGSRGSTAGACSCQVVGGASGGASPSLAMLLVAALFGLARARRDERPIAKEL
jgi:lysophospholipase L1-like esterase